MIVDYLGEQFIIELKIWHGNEYHERGPKKRHSAKRVFGALFALIVKMCISGRTIIEGVV